MQQGNDFEPALSIQAQNAAAKARQIAYDTQHRTALASDFELAINAAVNALVEFMSGHTTKTEVQNQLDSISTPDVAQVVEAIRDLTDVVTTSAEGNERMIAALSTIESAQRDIHSATTEHSASVMEQAVARLEKVVQAVNDSVSKLKLDPTINVEAAKPEVVVQPPDLSPIQKGLTEVVAAIKKQNLQVTVDQAESAQISERLDKSNELLKKLLDKRMNVTVSRGTSTPFTANDQPATVALVNGAMPVDTGSGSYETRIDTTSDPNLIYIGKAAPGSAVGAATWQIKRFDKTTMHTSFADAVSAFTKTWADREGYSY